MTTYALKQHVLDADRKKKVRKLHYITVASGLSWQDAKARRNAARPVKLLIVQERSQ